MKGSEYLVARTLITVAGIVTGGAVIAVSALFVVPWVVEGLTVLVPEVLPPAGGFVLGLAMVIAVSVSVRRILGYYLALFEQWVIGRGGIDDL